jgi:hypothetical protein
MRDQQNLWRRLFRDNCSEKGKKIRIQRESLVPNLSKLRSLKKGFLYMYDYLALKPF